MGAAKRVPAPATTQHENLPAKLEHWLSNHMHNHGGMSRVAAKAVIPVATYLLTHHDRVPLSRSITRTSSACMRCSTPPTRCTWYVVFCSLTPTRSTPPWHETRRRHTPSCFVRMSDHGNHARRRAVRPHCAQGGFHGGRGAARGAGRGACAGILPRLWHRTSGPEGVGKPRQPE